MANPKITVQTAPKIRAIRVIRDNPRFRQGTASKGKDCPLAAHCLLPTA